MRYTADVGPDVYFPRGRVGDALPMYVGMDVWCSRGGMDMPSAVMAMLGDRFAYYGTPVFNAYKMLAMGSVHRMTEFLYPSTVPVGVDWFSEERTIRHSYDDVYQIL
ncbi:unnamed protein product, partial [Phaeothamnion confervicola]